MSEIGEEEIAEALWQADSVRATGRRRLTQWSEEGPETHNAWRFMARAVLALLHPALERARREERERCSDPGMIGGALGRAVVVHKISGITIDQQTKLGDAVITAIRRP